MIEYFHFASFSTVYKRKLHNSLQELLRTIQKLEEKLSDVEYKHSQLQQEQETFGVEISVRFFLYQRYFELFRLH